MSHEATNWAIKQRGLKPAAKIVLWHLCDRFNPDMGCFPSQETLANDCELSRSSLNNQLEELEARGLIARERKRGAGGKQQRTRYRLGFEEGFDAEKPCPEIGHGKDGETESKNGGEPSPKNGDNRVQNLDSNPVREPVREPVSEREGAQARDDANGERETKAGPETVTGAGPGAGPGTAAFTKRVQRLVSGDGYHGGEWPKWAKSSLGYIEKMFTALDEEDRLEAERWRDACLAKWKAQGVRTPMPIGNYLRDKAWQTLTAAEMTRAVAATSRAKSGEGGDPMKPEGWVTGYGPAWASQMFLVLMAGPDMPDDAPTGSMWLSSQLNRHWPKLRDVRQLADMRGGMVVSVKARQSADSMEFVVRDTALFDAWRDEFDARGWPMFKVPDGMNGAYFPKGGPEGLAEWSASAEGASAQHDSMKAANGATR
tara:strand:+ start:12045 stop:13328 length:1284 start_codon:yes stop_codon:yes gene_type:complete